MDLALWQILLLAAVAFAAGVVDAIAGGGGLLTLPALMAFGVPPHLALATNKGQAVFGAAAAVARYGHAGLVDRAQAMVAFPAGLVGSALGAALVLHLSPELLRPVVLVLLPLAGVVVALRPRVQPHPVALRHARAVAAGIAIAIGGYDGFFGPGTGTFLFLAFATLLGKAVPHATADAKVVNLASNLGALGVMAFRGVVLWEVSLPMAVGQFAGSWVGAHLAVRRGEGFIRKVVLGVVVLLVLKLARDFFGA